MPILVGFFLALIANNDRIKGKTFFRTIYLLPWAIPAFITIMLFSLMTSSNGIITQTINTVFNLDISGKNDPNITRLAPNLITNFYG